MGRPLITPPLFASSRIAGEWAELPARNPLLAEIATQTLDLISSTYAVAVTVGDIFRSYEEDRALGGTGVHCRWGAVDVHLWNRPPSWSDPQASGIAGVMNRLYIYDPERPRMVVALFEPHASATAPHLHVQMHPRTIRRSHNA